MGQALHFKFVNTAKQEITIITSDHECLFITHCLAICLNNPC